MSEIFILISKIFINKNEIYRAKKNSPVTIYPLSLSFKEREGYISRDTILASSQIAFCFSQTKNQQKAKYG